MRTPHLHAERCDLAPVLAVRDETQKALYASFPLLTLFLFALRLGSHFILPPPRYTKTKLCVGPESICPGEGGEYPYFLVPQIFKSPLRNLPNHTPATPTSCNPVRRKSVRASEPISTPAPLARVESTDTTKPMIVIDIYFVWLISDLYPFPNIFLQHIQSFALPFLNCRAITLTQNSGSLRATSSEGMGLPGPIYQ